MSKKMSTSESGKSRKTRTNLEKTDADILCQILKTLDDGHVWKVIKEGVGTKQEMFLAWEKVSKLFNETTGKDLSRQQVRAFYQRIKAKKKEAADKKRLEEKEFHRSCQRTGGGPGPRNFPDIDGDNDLIINDEFDDIVEPVETNWNQFMGAKENEENVAPITESGNVSVQSLTMDKPRRSLPTARYISPVMQPLASISPNALLHRATPSPSPVASSSSCATGASPAPARSSCTQPVGRDVLVNEEIEVMTQDSQFSIVVEPPQSEKVKKAKGSKASNLNNSAADYYSEMLLIEKKLALQKTELLKEKIENEKLKQKILKAQLKNVNEKDSVLSDAENSSDDSSEESWLGH